MNFAHFWIKTVKVTTRITSISSPIIDHIVTSNPERVTKDGVIYKGLSDH